MIAVDSGITEIAAIRDASNQALLDRDIDALRSARIPDLQIMTSIGGLAASSGDMAARFSRTFTGTSLLTCHGASDEVRPSLGGTLEAARAVWAGGWNEPEGERLLEGVYFAQWRRTENGWRTGSELFMTLVCSGSPKCRTLRHSRGSMEPPGKTLHPFLDSARLALPRGAVRVKFV